jgi:hypothetical protein
MLRVEVTPIRAEEAVWNQYPGPELRLFNNQAGWFFKVTAVGQGPVKWVPTGTKLEINEATNTRYPYVSPETLLTPLLEHGRLQEQWALEGDLHLRAGSALEFRAAYLPPHPQITAEGVIAFAKWVDPGPIHSMRLTLAFLDDDGLHRLQWVFE